MIALQTIMLPDNDLYHRRSIPSSLARLALIGIASATGLAAATGINAVTSNLLAEFPSVEVN